MKGETPLSDLSSLTLSVISRRSSEGSPDWPQIAEEESRRPAAEVPEHPEENH